MAGQRGGEPAAKRAKRAAAVALAVPSPSPSPLPSPSPSLALLEPRWRRWARYEGVSLEDRRDYFAVSRRPLTERIEADLELVSSVVSHEALQDQWATGLYCCARCQHELYASRDKWRGPCVWPSFRKACAPAALLHVPAPGYNGYLCAVDEVYCRNCELFLGHAFEDGVAKGDVHPDARFRH